MHAHTHIVIYTYMYLFFFVVLLIIIHVGWAGLRLHFHWAQEWSDHTAHAGNRGCRKLDPGDNNVFFCVMRGTL